MGGHRTVDRHRIGFVLSLVASVFFGIVALFAGLATDSLGINLAGRIQLKHRLHLHGHPALNHTALLQEGWIIAVAGVLALIAWLAWLSVALARLREVSAVAPRFAPSQAVLLSILPGSNLVVPPLAVSELWAKSEPDHPSGLGRMLTVAWWMATLTAIPLVVAGVLSAPLHGGTNTQLISRDHWFSAAALALAAGAILAIVLMVGINDRLTTGAKRKAEAAFRTWAANEAPTSGAPIA